MRRMQHLPESRRHKRSIFFAFWCENALLINDLTLRVKHYSTQPINCEKDASIWEAFNLMKANDLRFCRLSTVKGNIIQRCIFFFLPFLRKIF